MREAENKRPKWVSSFTLWIIMGSLLLLLAASFAVLMTFCIIEKEISLWIRLSLFSINICIISVTFIFTLLTYRTVNNIYDEEKITETLRKENQERLFSLESEFKEIKKDLKRTDKPIDFKKI